jgi:outer membrane protein assembly factor BamD
VPFFFALALFMMESYLAGTMKRLPYYLPACACLFICTSMALAQQSLAPNTDEFQSTPTSVNREGRKTRSVFHRPEKDSAEEQLAYAEALEAKTRYRAARNEYNALVHHWHNSNEAPVAQFGLARVCFKQGKYTRAFDAFQYLVDYYSGRFKYNEVLDYQFRIANHMITDRWGDVWFLPGIESPERALPQLNKIIANAPNWEKASRVRLTIGMIYEDIKDYESAVTAYEAIAQFHSASDEAEDAAFRRASCLHTLSDKAPRDERRCRAALSALASFMTHHKKSARLAEAETSLATLKLRLENMYYNRALFYDDITKRPTSALIAYRDFLKKFPLSEHAKGIYARIEALELQIKE